MKITYLYLEEELKQEKWMPIPYYEQEYEASTLGRIRTKEDKTTFSKRHGIRHWQQRILKPKFCASTIHKKRYDGRVELWKGGNHKTYLVARLILASFDKRFDLYSKMTVNHIDGNPLNNKLENLEWCSRGDNIRKGFENGQYTSCKPVILLDKRTNKELHFISMSKASLYIKQKTQYISGCIKKGKYENENYKWKIE